SRASIPPPADHMALVLEEYSFWFKPGASQPEGPPALKDVSVSVEPGSLVLILGRSGSGKSTLALNLVGIYPDYMGGRNRGRVLIADPGRGLINRRELAAAERFRRVNMLFQNPEDQIVTLTVEEEVGFALENYLVEPAEIHRRIDEALDLAGLVGFRRRGMLELSGGEKQRVALAAMLALEPAVLILDEPTSNLDPAGTADVLATIDRIRARRGLTVMVIEHEVDEIFHRADMVLLVEGRRVAGPWTPRQFMEQRGLEIRDDMGLWIPQASEIALELRRRGLDFGSGVPLDGDELIAAIESLEDGPKQSAAFSGPKPDAPAGGLEPSGVAAALSPEAASSAAASTTVIEVRNVSFAYGERKVLDGVSLAANRSELLALVGQNGSGKSTLASLFNGIAVPDSGAVLVDGIPTTDYKFAHLARRVAHIFQVPEKQFVRATVHDEIAHGLRTLDLAEKEVEQRTLDCLRTVRLLERRDASPYVLSHGQKRRLSVAAMVVGEPDVVVLDEPTFGQDYHQARNLMELLRTLADSGAAVMFITHDMRLVAEYANRAVVLCDGAVAFDGTPGALFASPDVLTRARLRPPPVHEISIRLLGEPLLTTAALVERIAAEYGAAPAAAQDAG
ncbi:MAG: energy-coupling factor transporter ATPase, partial [Rhodospirillaceae bacterium]|nr:energy-coupling factor transporter ATPase [Rhodospirillaceae bacterium]